MSFSPLVDTRRGISISRRGQVRNLAHQSGHKPSFLYRERPLHAYLPLRSLALSSLTLSRVTMTLPRFSSEVESLRSDPAPLLPFSSVGRAGRLLFLPGD